MTDAPTSPDPIEIAMEAGAHDASPDSPARRLLVKQGRLLDYQLTSERMSIGLKALTGAAGLAAAFVLGLMAWNASQASGVVIEPLQAPPDLVARGVSGQMLASQIEDRVRRMQSQTISPRAEASYSDSWSHDLTVEIPQTGVSIGEVQRFLRQQLGHEVHVSGELFRSASGLRLSVRTTGQAGDTFDGSEADLDPLLQRAAEAVYGRTEPYRYSLYLAGQKRFAESIAVLKALAADGRVAERAWALSSLAMFEADPRRAIALAREAIQLQPDLAIGWYALWSGNYSLGDYEAYLAAGDRFLALVERSDHGGIDPKQLTQRHNVAASIATVAGDFSRARREGELSRATAGTEAIRAGGLGAEAYALGLLHEPAAAARLLGGASDGDNFTRVHGVGGETFYNAVYTDEDYAAAIRQLDGLIVAMRAAPGPSLEGTIHNRLLPLKMQQLTYAGRLDEARAIAAQIPADCYFCMSARGYLASSSGDAAGSDRWFGALIARSPHVAWAYFYRADSRLKRGDLDGAIEAARLGLKVGPHWADLHQVWGAALLARGDARGAAKKFAQAAQYAPRWGRLHLQWGDALAKLGEADEARVQWRAAATMDLAPSDRAALRAHGIAA